MAETIFKIVMLMAVYWAGMLVGADVIGDGIGNLIFLLVGVLM